MERTPELRLLHYSKELMKCPMQGMEHQGFAGLPDHFIINSESVSLEIPAE